MPPGNQLPDYAHHVIVPVANPKTAPVLLRLGSVLAHPEDGKVTALSIATGDTEKDARALDGLEPIIDELREEGYPVELVSAASTGIARGILDTVREHRADLLILGVRHPQHGEVVLGTIAENVAITAPCDVLIYRDSQKSTFNHVLIWANGSEAARVACYIGTLLSKGYQTEAEGIAVHSRGRPYKQARARIDKSLEGIPDNQSVKRTVVTADNLAEGLLSRLNEDDLLLVGFGRRSRLANWLHGDFAQQVLNRAPGPVILTSRTVQDPFSRNVEQGINWLRPVLTRIEQEDLIRQARESSTFTLDYAVLIVVAATLASLGLLLNSAAVIIGAMLVAPLMQPISAFSLGTITGNVAVIRRALTSLLIGVLMALLLAFFTGWLIPTQTVTAEMLSRGSPTLLDAGVAMASGIVGAYATARKGIPAALAGVAIAAALMPPICTSGLAIAFREPQLAFGSALLFVMNIAYISFAGGAVFLWLGMRPPKEVRSTLGGYVFMAVLVFLILPAVVILNNLRQQASDNLDIEQELQSFFEDTAEVNMVEVEGDNPLEVVATLRTDTIPSRATVREAQTRLEESLNRNVQLEVIIQRVIKPDE